MNPRLNGKHARLVSILLPAGVLLLTVAGCGGVGERPATLQESRVELDTGPFGGPAPEMLELDIEGGISRWDEGLPLGNGRLGVLVWGEGSTLRLSLDRGDLWDLRTPETVQREDWTYATMRALKEAGDHAQHVALFDVPYDTVPYPTKLPGVRLELQLPEGYTIQGYWGGLSDGSVSVNIAKPLQGDALLSAVLDLQLHPTLPIVYVEGLGRGEEVRWVRPGGLDRLGYDPARFEQGLNVAGPDWSGLEQDTAGGRMAAVAAWQVNQPQRSGPPHKAKLCAALVGGAADEDVLESARAMVVGEAAKYEVPGSYAERGVLWSPEDRPFVKLPNERLQLQYDLATYLYRATGRAGAPPMPLQGLWSADEGGLPPWKGDYHNDLNTQMTYAPYLAANLLDQGWTWIDFNWELLPRYRRFAAEFFGLSEDAAAIPGVMALNGDPLGGWGQYSLSATNGAWIAWQFAEAWRFTADEGFLRERAMPFCAAIGNGLLELLEPTEGGALRLPLSSSPEIHDNAYEAWLPANSNYDQALMMALFAANVEMAEALGDAQEADRWTAALARLEPLDVEAGSGAYTFARELPYTESHRHFSHAMAIHPLGLVSSRGSAAEQAAIAATLDALDEHGGQAWVGYSFAWAAAMNARGQRAERALELLEQYLCFTGPNGFHLNGEQCGAGLSGFKYRPFTLEGNFMAMDAIHEMLLWGDGVGLEVFPAVAAAWRDVRFERLRARGGLIVSGLREGGATRAVRVEATRATGVWLRDPFDGADGDPNWSVEPAERDGGRLLFELAAGQVLEGAL